MAQQDQGLVDLIEIYHARQLRDALLAQSRRIRIQSKRQPAIDEARVFEIGAYYDAALLTVSELLDTLGDGAQVD